jgi:hypothetical protein
MQTRRSSLTISASGAIEIVRTIAVDASTCQLIATITFDGGNGRGQQRPFRVVYDRSDE